MSIQFPISVLKTLWRRRDDGLWAISDIKGLELTSESRRAERYFVLDGDVQLMTNNPTGRSILELMSSFGTVQFLMQQSIVPVVVWRNGEHLIRCIGTASIISCTGYVLTAAHVVMDPLESGYGARREGKQIKFYDDLNFGVLVPFRLPAVGMTFRQAHLFLPFQKMWNWGEWKQSPLIHEDDRWEHLTDVAVCKVPEMPNGVLHQPLSMSLNPFTPGEDAYALGYAEMPDIQLNRKTGGFADERFQLKLHVSVGNILQTFPQNHKEREVPTPGPCFDFDARIPGKMSGAPIFGAQGAVIRGVVSRSFSGEDHAFGSMLGPAMGLPLTEPGISGRTLQSLLASGNEGMAIAMGSGL